jgi:hypothetical protein
MVIKFGPECRRKCVFKLLPILFTVGKQSSTKSTATKPAVNRASGRIRKAPVTKSDAFFVVNKLQSKSRSPKVFN